MLDDDAALTTAEMELKADAVSDTSQGAAYSSKMHYTLWALNPAHGLPKNN